MGYANQKAKGITYDSETVLLSFETGEQGAVKLRMPVRAKVVGLQGIAVKAIADTDSGTVTPSSAGGNMTSGTLTWAASDAIGVEKTAIPTANHVIAAGGYIILTPAKTTAGGKVSVCVTYQRLS